MPAVQFFAMLKHARIAKAMDGMQSCDIAAIAAANPKYYEHVRRRFENVLESYVRDEVKKSQPEREPLDGDAARDLMFDLFSARKRTTH